METFNSPSIEKSNKKFYGIYRGLVVDTQDPLQKNRLKVKVPQVTGEAITNWAWPLIGGINQGKTPYGIFTRNTVATANSTTIAYPASYDTTEDSGGGVYLDANNPSRIYVPKSGDYQILFSPQFYSANASAIELDMWLRVNGVDVPRSNSRMTVASNNTYNVVTIPFIIDLESGDYIEVVWRSSKGGVTIQTDTGLTGPTRPDIPAIITQVSLIGNYHPDIGEGIWVTYEGGDPNFPIWIGVF